MSRPYVNGSFAQQGRQRRKNRIILLVALLAVLCLVGVIAAAIASNFSIGKPSSITKAQER